MPHTVLFLTCGLVDILRCLHSNYFGRNFNYPLECEVKRFISRSREIRGLRNKEKVRGWSLCPLWRHIHVYRLFPIAEKKEARDIFGNLRDHVMRGRYHGSDSDRSQKREWRGSDAERAGGRKQAGVLWRDHRRRELDCEAAMSGNNALWLALTYVAGLPTQNERIGRFQPRLGRLRHRVRRSARRFLAGWETGLHS